MNITEHRSYIYIYIYIHIYIYTYDTHHGHITHTFTNTLTNTCGNGGAAIPVTAVRKGVREEQRGSLEPTSPNLSRIPGRETLAHRNGFDCLALFDMHYKYTYSR